jgi:hypothetical protein
MGAAVGMKRKHADFSWQAVMADIDAKDAAEKRSKAAAAANGSANGKAAAAAAATAAAAAASQPAVALPGGQQQQAAAAAMAGKYIGMQVTPLDPLALHRPFCPWVNNTQASCRCLKPCSALSLPTNVCNVLLVFQHHLNLVSGVFCVVAGGREGGALRLALVPAAAGGACNKCGSRG